MTSFDNGFLLFHPNYSKVAVTSLAAKVKLSSSEYITRNNLVVSHCKVIVILFSVFEKQFHKFRLLFQTIKLTNIS